MNWELIARLLGITIDEAQALGYDECESRLSALFDDLRSADVVDDDTLAQAREVRDAVVAVRAARAEETAAAEARAAELAVLEADITGETPADDDAGGDDDAADEPAGDTDDDDTDDAADAEDATTEPAEAVAAAAAPIVRPVRVVPAHRRPAPRPAVSPIAITAAADIPGVQTGGRLTTPDQVREAFVSKVRALGNSAGNGERVPIVRLDWRDSYPEARKLGKTPSDMDLVRDAYAPAALVASGGFCAPLQPRYEVFGVGDTDRPVAASFAQFDASRGGGIFMPPPVLSDAAVGASFTNWTSTIDAAPGEATKACSRYECVDATSVETDALVHCVEFGNFNARTYPEMVDAFNNLVMVNFARRAERKLLTRLGALSTAVTDATQVLGAARDFLEMVTRVTAQERNRQRDFTSGVRVTAPLWLRDMIVADLMRELPGSTEERLRTANGYVDSFFPPRGVNITWALDGETGQEYAAQGAGVGVRPWNTSVIWYWYWEGSYVYMDGGTLDLGVVRDSTLNGTNDFQMFGEQWEQLARVGIPGYKITQTLCPDGSTAAAADTGATCVAGS